LCLHSYSSITAFSLCILFKNTTTYIAMSQCLHDSQTILSKCLILIVTFQFIIQNRINLNQVFIYLSFYVCASVYFLRLHNKNCPKVWDIYKLFQNKYTDCIGEMCFCWLASHILTILLNLLYTTFLVWS
jgi:hypothetical protein